MTTCPKCQSNKVTKRYFAVGDWCKAIVGHYRYFCFDCGHQWAAENFTATGKNIVSPSAISEMQSALGAKSQAAEVLMLEAAEKLKDIKYVAEQYKQAAHHAVEENQKLRDELKLIRSENVAQRNKALEDMGRETELKFWRNEVAKLQQEPNIAKARNKKLWIANGKLKQQNEALEAGEKLLKDRILELEKKSLQAEKIKECFTLKSRVEFLEEVCRSAEETMQRWQKENTKLRDEVENLRIENTALRNQIARDVGVAASREINYLRAKVKQLEAANIALVTKGTVWERENVPEDIRDLVAQGMSPTEADLMNHWGSSLEATKKLCKILGRKAPSRLRNATDILEKHIIPLIEGGRLDHIAKTMDENHKLKQQNEELTGALNNLAGKEQELKRRIKVHEDYEKQHHERLIDLVIKWRSRACIVWSDGAADTLHDCAEELEEQL